MNKKGLITALRDPSLTLLWRMLAVADVLLASAVPTLVYSVRYSGVPPPSPGFSGPLYPITPGFPER